MGHFGADELVDLCRRIFLAVHPFVNVFAQPRLHHVLHFHIEVVALNHALQYQRHSYRVSGGVGVDETLVGGLDIIRSASGKHTVNRDVIIRPGRVTIRHFAQILNRHRSGTALTVTHQVNILVLGLHINRFKPFTRREIHVGYVLRRLYHHEVWMYLVGCDAVPSVIRNNQSVAQFDEHAFKREAVRRCFGIGADGVMADENHALGLATFRQHDFAGQCYRIPVSVGTGISADDFNHFVLVSVFQQLLHDSRTGDATGLARTVDAFVRHV